MRRPKESRKRVWKSSWAFWTSIAGVILSVAEAVVPLLAPENPSPRFAWTVAGVFLAAAIFRLYHQSDGNK